MEIKHRKPRRPSKMDAVMKQKGYLPAVRMAELIGVSLYTVYRWEEEGRITGQHIGSRRYMSVASVAAYMGHDAAVLLGLEKGAEPCVSS
jgi:hypothetical protein